MREEKPSLRGERRSFRPSVREVCAQAKFLERIGKEIARQLNISLATTKSHVHNLLGKLNVQRRSQVAEYMREYGNHPA